VESAPYEQKKEDKKQTPVSSKVRDKKPHRKREDVNTKPRQIAAGAAETGNNSSESPNRLRERARDQIEINWGSPENWL